MPQDDEGIVLQLLGMWSCSRSQTTSLPECGHRRGGPRQQAFGVSYMAAERPCG